MDIWKRLRRSNFLIKLRSWEYWPFGIVHLPAFIYWLWLSLRARSFVFFSASNPGIPMGGLFGESKFDVLEKISPKHVPTTILVTIPTTTSEIMLRIQEAGLKLPVIFKPDIGERGIMVRRIRHEKEIAPYLASLNSALIVQELVDAPLEFGVFYLKFPMEAKGRVVSVVGKEMLSVTGDGRSTLQQLILEKDRAKLQWEKLRVAFNDQLHTVLEAGKKVELVSIGNHALGTRFINANNLITDRLSEVFDDISRQIPGFYFGRYDLRCWSIDDLYEGNIKILELNGCGAEPAHIYDSQYSLWQAFFDLVKHWDMIFRIARANNQRGIKYVSHRQAYAYYRKFKSAVR